MILGLIWKENWWVPKWKKEGDVKYANQTFFCMVQDKLYSSLESVLQYWSECIYIS